MYEELNNETIQNLESVNMDLLALYNDKSDIIDEFKNRGFKTIIGNAWTKWIQTMESIENE